MDVSVAMGTYNGAAYLGEQLASIAAQTRLPDELVVCDDRSTDDTAAIVRRFAATVPFAVRLEVNRRNLGARDNFAKAVGLCRGRWIVLADQDDVWMPDKIGVLVDALADHAEAGFAFSDALLIDSAGRPLGSRLWETIRFGRREQRHMDRGRVFEVLLRRNVVTGATMVFRAEYRDLLLPIPAGWVHDAWFALLISALAGCVAIPQPLVEYRQHSGQQIGVRRRTLYENYLRVRQRTRADFQAIADAYAVARDRLRQFSHRLRDGRVIARLERKIEHFRAKVRMRTSPAWRLPLILRELASCHYLRYSTGWRSLAQDVFL
jgi:glycosyltransferase involved in cell wall biosynthesis